MIKRSTTLSLCGRVFLISVAITTASLTAFADVTKIRTLTIGNGIEYIVPENDTVIVEKIVFSEDATLRVNGTLIIEDVNGFSDFAMNRQNQGNQGKVSVLNYGKIECKNFNLDNNVAKGTLIFQNSGTIVCEENFTATLDSNITYSSLCDSKIEAENIILQGRAGQTYNGIYIATCCTIDITERNVSFDLGSNCGTSKFDVQKLLLKHNAKGMNIKEQAHIRSLDVSNTSQNSSIEVDGILTLGVITGYEKLHIKGSDDAILNLCYNPTGNRDFLATTTYTGRVVYLQRNDLSNAWNSEKSPKIESDIQGSYSEIPDKISTYEECLNAFHLSSLLPIEMDSLIVKGSKDLIHLEWEVATEKKIYNYKVEYSINGTDWKEIDVVDAMGTTSLSTHYTSSIANNFPFVFLYFRIKQTSFDGLVAYSHTTVYNNTSPNKLFKTLKVGPLDILYKNGELRYIIQ